MVVDQVDVRRLFDFDEFPDEENFGDEESGVDSAKDGKPECEDFVALPAVSKIEREVGNENAGEHGVEKESQGQFLAKVFQKMLRKDVRLHEKRLKILSLLRVLWNVLWKEELFQFVSYFP